MTFRDTSADTTLDGANMGTREDFEAWINDSAADATIVSDVLKKLPKKIDAAFAGYVAGNLNRQPEIDALKDSLHRADIDARNFCQQSIDRLADIQQLKTENERLRKDAERYRWLKANCFDYEEIGPGEPIGQGGLVFASTEVTQLPDSLDSAIDAAKKDFSTTKKEEKRELGDYIPIADSNREL